ncbi:MAG TPA: hypothetical protein VNB22_18430 [Pyrinomonadaceae bacterium]|nr:hypothetical protein [Pyrinomonadaceae bacterium]
MKVFKSSLLFFIAVFFITACNQSPTEDVYNQPYQIGRTESGFLDENDRFARENLDLQAVGSLLQKANNAEDLEYLLNSEENGINNLDLNDDGYADYIGVREFDDRDGNERGFSLFSMFGPDLIQEIATIIFDRNGNNYPGARVLLRGDEDLYGDNYYYETDWQDRNVPFVNWAYTDRNDYYNSPYYYENYPSYYEPYQVVETPVYRTRVEQYYTTPVFIQTAQPTITQINIVSPYKDKSLNKAYSNLPKPTREQLELRKNNPKSAEFDRNGKENKDWKENKNFAVKEDKQFKDNPNKFENQERIKNDKPQEMREKPNKPERVNVQPQNQMKVERQNQPKFERQNQQRVERQQMKVERQQNQPARVERQNPVKMERPNMKPQKQENRPQPNGNGGGKQNGGGNNPGGGGGGNKGGGGGKGKGKP